jgi:sulfate adenylyltransferase subunit 1
VDLTFDEPLVLDPYQQNPVTGGLIFIDRLTNVTVGAGMVNEPHLQARRRHRSTAPLSWS